MGVREAIIAAARGEVGPVSDIGGEGDHPAPAPEVAADPAHAPDPAPVSSSDPAAPDVDSGSTT